MFRSLSGIPIATSASRLFFREHRPAAVTDDESPIVAVHIEPICVVPGRRMGLFRNSILSLPDPFRCAQIVFTSNSAHSQTSSFERLQKLNKSHHCRTCIHRRESEPICFVLERLNT
ncbi:hypothetical protein Zmor_003501 [Zophobas morio]|uniref:Uncharacterized protein n=1 Tax=Zophobas morio TaxID=2755281 RepID=A0AA38HMF6_9CUCU|nr:hypothetical protein Zmor_003501 [Zophobas morio]